MPIHHKIASGARKTAAGVKKARARVRDRRKPAKRVGTKENPIVVRSRAYQAGFAAAKKGKPSRGVTSEYRKGYLAGQKER